MSLPHASHPAQPENSPSLPGNTGDIPVRRLEAPEPAGYVVCGAKALELHFPPTDGSESQGEPFRYTVTSETRLLFVASGVDLLPHRAASAVVAQLDLARPTPGGEPPSAAIWDEAGELCAVVKPVGDGADVFLSDSHTGPEILRFARRRPLP